MTVAVAAKHHDAGAVGRRANAAARVAADLIGRARIISAGHSVRRLR